MGIFLALLLITAVAKTVISVSGAVIAVKIAYEVVKWDPASNNTLPPIPESVVDSKFPRFPKKRKYSISLPGTDQVPHHVSILLRHEHYCSGSLITARHVLTSGQCVRPFLDRTRGITKMSYNVVVVEDESGAGTVLNVHAIAVPRPYVPKVKDMLNDISVIQVHRDVKLSKYANLISLPAQAPNYLYDGHTLNGTDFGPTLDSRKTLRKFGVIITSNRTCQQYFPDRNLTGKFCAFTAPKYGTCQGETGTPVTVNSMYIIGIFIESSDLGCGYQIPDLYSSVPHYAEFIKTQTRVQ